jgi:cell division transport system permease protein
VSDPAPAPPLIAWHRPAPLLPAEDARDGALVFVVAVLCFIACLSVVAALAANRAAHGWSAELKESATVVVRAGPTETADAAAAHAAEVLSGVSGVTEADALEKDKAEALLEPWLGKGGLPEDLAIPRLVSVDLDARVPATAAAMSQALKAAGVDATVDDHSLWLKDILRAGLITQVAAIGIAGLIVAAAAAVIAFATRAGLQARGDLVSVLHLAGAEDAFIARLFQLRFARLAAIAALTGAGGAAIITAAARLLGGGDGFTPVLPVAWADLLPLLICPVAAAAVAALAAWATAMALLREMA